MVKRIREYQFVSNHLNTRFSIKSLVVACLALAASVAGKTAHAQAVCGSAQSGDCLVVHPSPGCSNQACCQTVCDLVPDCCLVGWDEFCVELANSECPFLCGASGAGDCRVPHTTPACNDAVCCALVCNIDPACCQFQWDLLCTFQAQFQCEPPPPVPCGAPNSGSCTEPNGTPSCNNVACCNTVCSIDPHCCNQSWDVICVQLANSYCFGCSLSCPAGSVSEVESCGVRANDICTSGQAVQSISCGNTVCGTLDGVVNNGIWTGDRDGYAFTAVDSNGDGVVRVTLRLTPEYQAFAALLNASCPAAITSSIMHVNAADCLQSSVTMCIAPGNYWVLVATGTYPNPGLSSTLDCMTVPRYSLAVECSQITCGDTCSPTAGSCYASHNNPGCDDTACCAAVCAVDAYCCSIAWDTACVTRAGQVCGLPQPANDDCTGALPILTNETVQFNTVAATISAPPIPASCEGGEGVLIGPDLWYRYVATCSGNLTINTCTSATDLRLVVYEGECDGLTLVACNTDSVICLPVGGSRVNFIATCDKPYYIRVGGDSPSHLGAGQLQVECPGPACPGPCPADFNGSGIVDGADLGALLAAWGTAKHDLTGDGVVSGADLGDLLAQWGPCPTQ